jgi:hypothetical protein
MSTHTIAEVKKFPVGTVVPAVTGTVKAVFQRKTGDSQYGPWSLQGVVLSDGAEEIVCTCWGCDDLSYLKGTTVSVAALGENHKTHKKQGLELIAGKDKEGNPRPELKMDHKKGGFIGGDKPNPANNPPAPAIASPDLPRPAPQSPPVVAGVTVGMAINCAVRMATASGNTDIAAIEAFARDLIALSNKLQSGN